MSLLLLARHGALPSATWQQGCQLVVMQQCGGAGTDDGGPASQQKSPETGKGPAEDKCKLVWADKAPGTSNTNSGAPYSQRRFCILKLLAII